MPMLPMLPTLPIPGAAAAPTPTPSPWRFAWSSLPVATSALMYSFIAPSLPVAKAPDSTLWFEVYGNVDYLSKPLGEGRSCTMSLCEWYIVVDPTEAGLPSSHWPSDA